MNPLKTSRLHKSVEKERRSAFKSKLARDVSLQRIGASAAVVLLYKYDHPGMSLKDAADACGVPMVCVAEI